MQPFPHQLEAGSIQLNTADGTSFCKAQRERLQGGDREGSGPPLRAVLCRLSSCSVLAQSSLTVVCPVQPGASTPKGKASGSPGSLPDRSAASAIHGCTLHHSTTPVAASCCDKAHGRSTRTQCQPGSTLQPLAE